MRGPEETVKGRDRRVAREFMFQRGADASRFKREDQEEGTDPPRLHLVQAYLRTMGVPKP